MGIIQINSTILKQAIDFLIINRFLGGIQSVSTCVRLCICVCVSVRSSVRPSVRPSTRPSARSSVRPSVLPSVHPSVHPSVRPSVPRCCTTSKWFEINLLLSSSIDLKSIQRRIRRRCMPKIRIETISTD